MAIFPPEGRACRKSTAEPTPIQARIVEYIMQYRDVHGYSPTLQEIADHIGRSKVTVLAHVRTLQHKGIVGAPKRYRARQLRLTGRWLPPAAREPAENPFDVERQLGVLAAACREILIAAQTGSTLTPKLEDALQAVEACLTSSPLPSAA